jgi:uncharacterized membrane protein
MKFSKKEAILFGWQIAKRNIKFFTVLLSIVFLISISSTYIEKVAKEKNQILYLLAWIFFFVITIILEMGLIKIWLNFSTSLQSRISDLFSQYHLFFSYFFATCLYNLIVFLGFIFFVIPGVYLGIRLSFFRYFIVDKKSKIGESLKKSWQITKGNFWNLFWFNLLCSLISILGLICFLVGLLWAIPTTEIATAFVYQKLKHGENKIPYLN